MLNPGLPSVSEVGYESHGEELEAGLQEEDDGQDPVEVIEGVDQDWSRVIPKEVLLV